MSAGTLAPATTDTAANPLALEPKYQLITAAFDFDATDDGRGGEPQRGVVVSGRGLVLERIADHEQIWFRPPKADGLDVTRVAGVSYRRAQLQDPSFDPGRSLALVPEPTNAHDPHAMAVWNEARTLQIGYLPRTKAAKLAKDTSTEPLACLSLWEYRKQGQRVALRVLLVWGRARVRGLSFFRRATSSPDPANSDPSGRMSWPPSLRSARRRPRPAASPATPAA